MILGLQKILLSLLVLLQFIAPLVHAHTDHDPAFTTKANFLEIDTLLVGHKNHVLQSFYHFVDNHHAIININTGIQDKKISMNNHHLFTYLIGFLIINQVNSVLKINFPPQSDIPKTSLIFKPQSPRAPPYI